MLREFREFLNRGNFMDLAVGFVMGVAVTGVVTAIVERLVMPVVGLLFGQPDFEQVGRFACQAGECAGSIGAVLTALVNLLLVAVVLFLAVRAYNRLQRRREAIEEAAEEAAPDPEELVLLREIRDALRGRAN